MNSSVGQPYAISQAMFGAARSAAIAAPIHGHLVGEMTPRADDDQAGDDAERQEEHAVFVLEADPEEDAQREPVARLIRSKRSREHEEHGGPDEAVVGVHRHERPDPEQDRRERDGKRGDVWPNPPRTHFAARGAQRQTPAGCASAGGRRSATSSRPRRAA